MARNDRSCISRASLLRIAAACAVALVTVLLSQQAHAVTCTIQGTVKIEPLDSYYCDTNHSQDCSGWTQVDLDAARGAQAKPIRYMAIEIWQGSSFLGLMHSNSVGSYSKSFALPGSTCSGQGIQLRWVMRRVHESDVSASNPRYRFKINVYEPGEAEEDMLTVWYTSSNITLSGSTHTHNPTVGTTINHTTRLFNLYYTADSAIGEMVTWSPRIATHFASTSAAAGGVTRILFGDGWPVGGGDMGAANSKWWHVLVGYSAFNKGSFIRHEFGHLVRHAIHDKLCNWETACSTSNLRGSSNWHLDSCEYGSNAMDEGLAGFFAARSVTSNSNNSWTCACGDTANQDVCSETAATLSTDGRIAQCPGMALDFIAIGDRWVTTTAHCVPLQTARGCPGTNRSIYGWRNVVQASRFLWDLIDTSTDGGYDTVSYSIQSLIGYMETMPTNYGVDGSCDESERASPDQCVPTVDGDIPVAPTTGTRDAYNVRDFRDMLPADTSWVASINCASFATD
ncbi:MAG: hypothetical protein IT376_10785 [Polyangiaceae bacterium]|nr:hypothetical protein [Polyangiaceae bacterium]